jgi:anaerobic ribonucleoside-triphosphate reductase
MKINQGVVSINLPQIGIIADGDEEKFLSFANFIADAYEEAGEVRSARIIRKRIDGSYKDEPQVSLD